MQLNTNIDSANTPRIPKGLDAFQRDSGHNVTFDRDGLSVSKILLDAENPEFVAE